MTPEKRKKLVEDARDAVDSVFLEYTSTCTVEMLDDITTAALAVVEDRIRNEVLSEVVGNIKKIEIPIDLPTEDKLRARIAELEAALTHPHQTKPLV